MKILQYIGLISIFILLNSCQESGLLGEISELRGHAEDALGKVQTHDLEVLKNNKNKAAELIKELSPYFTSLDKPSLKTLVDLANTEKGHRKMKISPDKINTSLQFSVDQLNALYHEYKIDSLSKEQAQKYFEDEKKALDKLTKASENFGLRIELTEDHYLTLIPKAQHLVDSIKALN